MTDPHSPTALFTPAPGQVLGGRFRVERTIGAGGMGVVVEATNTLTGKRVAIKWMHPTVAAHPESAQRFVREAQASARVRHPNVIDVYDVVRDGESLFLVMELLDGEPLSAVLARGGYPAHELISVLIDAMRGVSAAHKQGVIHRDIKPDNIFLTHHPDRERPLPKVLDFGISKLTGTGEGIGLTRTGTTMGTPMYMSFEQLCNAKDIDQRTDVYAFAVILYEALTGQTPYHAETFAELVVKVTSTIPARPKAVQPSLPDELDRIVFAAMAKDREARTPSIDALVAALLPFATQAGFAAAGAAHKPVTAAPVTQLPASQIDAERMSTPMATSVVPPDAIPRSSGPMRWVIASALALIGAGIWLSQSGGGARNEPAIDAAHQAAAEPHVLEPAPKPSSDHAPALGGKIANPPPSSHAAVVPSTPPQPVHAAPSANDAGVSAASGPAAAARDAHHHPHERTDRAHPREPQARPSLQPKPPAAQPGSPAPAPATVLRAGRVHADDF